jgi:hypothetical protein
MSMIFKRPKMRSPTYPWGSANSQLPSDKYRRIEQVYSIIGIDVHMQESPEPQQLAKHTKPHPRKPDTTEEDIHFYFRVQIIEISVRLDRAANVTLKKAGEQHKPVYRPQDWDDVQDLARVLMDPDRLPEQDCLDAIMGLKGHIGNTGTINMDVPFAIPRHQPRQLVSVPTWDFGGTAKPKDHSGVLQSSAELPGYGLRDRWGDTIVASLRATSRRIDTLGADQAK